MEGVLIILDGLGDRDCKKLNGKTPLEAAKTPNMDYLASKGELGVLYTVKKKFVPESDEAVVSILGNDPFENARGQLEAFGAGIKLERGDLALRTNFGSVTGLDGEVEDRRAGRTLTSKEAKILGKAINKNINLSIKFIFKPTIHHRGVLVFKGGFSDNISDTDPSYTDKGKFKKSLKLRFSKPLDENDENDKYTANMLNEFMEQSFKVLDKHEVNKERIKKGLLPANIIFARGGGTELPKIRELKNWGAVVYMPVEIGIALCAKMDIFKFDYPDMKNLDVYKNLYDGLNKAINFSIKVLKKEKKNYEHFYIHFKETDLPGHDNKPLEKKNMLEVLDKKFFSFIRKYAEKEKIKVIVTGDHSTPCELKSHSDDPVPFLLCDWHGRNEKKFSEKSCKKGKLGELFGKDVLRLVS